MSEVYLDSGSCRGMGGEMDTLIYYCEPILDSELQCGICLGIVDDPVSCGHECIGRYCHGCLSRALQSARSACPTCKRETHRPVRDLPLKARLGRMEVFCPKSKITQVGQKVGENCCVWRGRLDEWNTHNVRDCVYSTVRCLCKQYILRSELFEHQEKCFRQIVRCKCKLEMCLGQLSQHIKEECYETILKCKVCGECVSRRLCAEHLALHHPPDPVPEDIAPPEVDIRHQQLNVQLDLQMLRQRRCRQSNKTSYLNRVDRLILNNPNADDSLKTFLTENRNNRTRNPFNVIFLPKFRRSCDVLSQPSPSGPMLEQALCEYWNEERDRKRQRRVVAIEDQQDQDQDQQ